ncbi:c-type cytochrome [Desulfonatronospira sp.]|uniref:c-type cytochrome n=1 Tax=Desulfonatronospira sp. TaxID=1962951 RepID=UPI0025C1DE5D|nr:c-type cytochrome [Desulfonatronospira sp.]
MNRFLTIICTVAVVVFLSLSMDLRADSHESGEKLVEQLCTGCHGLSRVQEADKSLEEWESSVQRMISYGARISHEEKEAVVEYLAGR